MQASHFFLLCSHETARDPGKVGTDENPGPELVRAAGLCLNRRRPLRRPHLANIKSQIMIQPKLELLIQIW